MGHQLPAVDTLADGFVGSGQIHDDLRAAQGQHGRGRQGRPQILTDFHAHQCALADLEQQVLPHRHRLWIVTQQGANIKGILNQVVAGSKPPFFIELIIIGNAGFRHDTPDFAAGNDSCTVEHSGADPQRQANGHRHRWAGGGSIQNLPQTPLHTLMQGILKE